MVLLNRVKNAVLVCAALLLIGQQGCSSRPVKSPILAQPGLSGEKIGLVIKRAPQGEGLKIPTKGAAGSIGRGAEAGAAGLSEILFRGGPMGLIVGIPAVALGAAVGALSGSVASEAESKWWEGAEAIFRDCLTEQDFGHLLETRLIPFAQETGCPLRSINGMKTGVDEPVDCKGLSEEGTGLVLELSEVTIRLREADMSINNPFLSFATSVRTKVFRTNDGTMLDDRVIADDMGEARTRDDWALDNGTAFRDELSRAAKRMAEVIVTELFLPPPPSVQRTTGSDLMMSYTAYGLMPIYPPAQYPGQFFPQKVSSLQPTFKWEPYYGENVTYDLNIWLGGRDGLRLIYSRQGLPEPFHTLETPLQPHSSYQWTVRARYTTGGLTRMTEWARWSQKASPLINQMTLGMSYLMKPLPETPMHYIFQTK